MSLVDLAIRRPVTITMLVLAVFIFGYVSFERLDVNLLPDISYPSLTVRTEYEGAAPEEVENLVSRRIEEVVGVIGGLVEVSSVSRAGVSDVVLEFDWDTDMNLAIMDVRERVDRVFLPDGAERPLLLRYNPQLDPIIRLGLSGEDLTMLRDMAEWELKRQLETIPGVASVRIKGGLEEEIQVEIDEAQLTRLGLTFQQINQRLAAENINQAGGRLKEGEEELLVRAVNEFQTVEEIGEIIITRPNGAPVKLKDVATVRRFHKERKTITRINGKESVELALFKEADANTVTVARMIKDRLGNVKGAVGDQDEDKQNDRTSDGGRTIVSALPEGASLHIISDQSRFIEGAIDEVLNTAIQGGVLAILVLFLFLRSVKSTMIIGAAIPVSVLMTFTLMFFSGTTLNIMSLGGLALGIGMLVDNAIVVLESIFRCREEGDDILEAARRGASEVGMAVTASTLTTIAVFFPIVFVKGIAGQIFTDQALTVTFALMASLAVALTFIPMLASREGGAKGVSGSGLWVQAVYHRFRNLPPDDRPAVAGWFFRTAGRDMGQWFMHMFPGLAWFKTVAQRFRQWSSESPSKASWAGFYPVYMAGRFFVEAGYWLKGCVIQRKENRSNEQSVALWIRLLKGIPLWLVTFVFRFIMPFFDLIRFLLGSALRIVFTLAPNLVLLVLVPVWFLLKYLFIGLGYVVRPILWLFDGGFRRLQDIYIPTLAWSLSNRGKVLMIIAAIVATSMTLIPRLGTELIPELEQGEFTVDLTLPVGTPLAATDATATSVERMIREDEDVDRVYVVVGETETGGTLATEERENVARIGVMLKTGSVNQQAGERVAERLRRQLQNIPDATVEFARPALFSFKTPLEVEVRGYNLTDLRTVSEQVVSSLADLDGLRDVRSTMEAGHPEIVVVFDRDRMAALGVDLGQAAQSIRNKVRGSVATRFAARDRKIDIRVRAREEDRKQVAQLKALTINTGSGRQQNTQNRPGAAGDPQPANPEQDDPIRSIPLNAVASIEVGEGPSEIRRIDQQRVALVTANLTGIDLGSMARAMDARLAEISLPDEFAVDIGGQYREMNTASQSMLMAMAMAIFLVYLVMASQFESLIHPFIIMFSFLLALVGVLLTIYLLNIAISVIVLIGVIMLAGIVVNNAIVLVDYINQLRRRGEDRINAIMTAGRVRLRPIVMTTATTVLGLLPMALGIGEGAEIRTPLAITVIAGLISSTILTLIVIPVIYTLVDRKSISL